MEEVPPLAGKLILGKWYSSRISDSHEHGTDGAGWGMLTAQAALLDCPQLLLLLPQEVHWLVQNSLPAALLRASTSQQGYCLPNGSLLPTI